nr:hypothetical protein [Polymorphobacter sp.]
MRWLNTIWRWLLAVIVTTITACVVHSWTIQQGLIALGIDIPFGLRLRTAFNDFIGLAPALGAILAIALAIGFLIAAFLGPRLKVPAIIAYPLAGAVATGVTLWIMALQMHITPIASAREPLGFALLCMAGALGGLVFVLARRR